MHNLKHSKENSVSASIQMYFRQTKLHQPTIHTQTQAHCHIDTEQHCNAFFIFKFENKPNRVEFFRFFCIFRCIYTYERVLLLLLKDMSYNCLLTHIWALSRTAAGGSCNFMFVRKHLSLFIFFVNNKIYVKTFMVFFLFSVEAHEQVYLLLLLNVAKKILWVLSFCIFYCVQCFPKHIWCNIHV